MCHGSHGRNSQVTTLRTGIRDHMSTTEVPNCIYISISALAIHCIFVPTSHSLQWRYHNQQYSDLVCISPDSLPILARNISTWYPTTAASLLPQPTYQFGGALDLCSIENPLTPRLQPVRLRGLHSGQSPEVCSTIEEQPQSTALELSGSQPSENSLWHVGLGKYLV